MSRYIRTLSLYDQGTIDRPDFPPSTHDPWEKDMNCSTIEPACQIVGNISIQGLHSRHEKLIPRIRRRDLEAFTNTWLKTNFLRGHWRFTNWPEVGSKAAMILQYKTFRIGVFGGAGPVTISTADVNNILTSCLNLTDRACEEMPSCTGTLLYGNQSVQWMLAPVERTGIYGLDETIKRFRSMSAKATEMGRKAKQDSIAAEMSRRPRIVSSKNFPRFLKKHGISSQRLQKARGQKRVPSELYDPFLDEELEQLFNLVGANDAEPDPLPLRADERSMLLFDVLKGTMDIIDQREAWEQTEQLKELGRQLTPQFDTSLNVAANLSSHPNFIARQPRSVENNQQVIQQFWGGNFHAAANDPRMFSSRPVGPELRNPVNVRKEVSIRAVNYALDDLQAGTFPDSNEYSPTGAGPSQQLDFRPRQYDQGYSGQGPSNSR